MICPVSKQRNFSKRKAFQEVFSSDLQRPNPMHMFFRFGKFASILFQAFSPSIVFVRRASGEITHIRIQRTNDGFDLGERQECFSTLYDMIEHYRQNVGELREKNNEIIELTVPILAQMPTLEKCVSFSLFPSPRCASSPGTTTDPSRTRKPNRFSTPVIKLEFFSSEIRKRYRAITSSA